MDTDSFVLSVNTKNIIKDLKNLYDLFDFINLSENHELFSNENKKVIGKFKNEFPKSIWIDKFLCLLSKQFLFIKFEIIKFEFLCSIETRTNK